MKKILLFILLLIPLNVYAVELPQLYSKKVIIYDLTENKVLQGVKTDEVSSIASLTKLMTVLVGVETIENLDEEITITSEMIAGVPWDASIAYIKVGSTLTYRDLLYGVMLPSGADAAYAIARTTAGSLDKYVELMNDKAKELSMKNTNYKNVTGLDKEGHYSTIDDILILLKYALKNKDFYDIYTTKEYTMKNEQKLESTVNAFGKRLDRSTDRILGSKTGFTDDAGTCISALFKSNGHDFLLITLSAPPEPMRAYHINDALDLISFVDNNYNNQLLIAKNTLVKSIKVSLSKIDKYDIKTSVEVSKFLPNNYDKSKLTIKYEGEEDINFTINKGSKLGDLSIYYEDELLRTEEIILNTNIDADVLKIFDKYKVVIVSITLISLLLIAFITIIFKRIYSIKKAKHKSKK